MVKKMLCMIKKRDICYNVLLFIILLFIGINSANAGIPQDTTLTESLSGVIVKAKLAKRTPDGDEYLITSKMRDVCVNTLDLLAQIPGLQLNRASNKIQINNKNNILFLVNGRPRSNDYIISLSPKTVKRVKIIHNPKGRFSSEGYDAVIEIIAKNNDGWDVNLSNMLLANLSYNNKGDHILMEQPALNIAYTHEKISVYTFANYGKSDWNTPKINELRYSRAGVNTITSVQGIEEYSYNGRSGSAGINYRITPQQVISFDYEYLHENDNVGNKMKGNNISYFQLDNTCRISNTYTLYYKGQFNDKVSIYSDLSINNYKNRYNNLFRNSDEQSRTILNYSIAKMNCAKVNMYGSPVENVQTSNTEKRRAIDFSVDLNWALSNKVSLKLGTLFHDRKFYTEAGNFDYHRTQSREWCYLLFNPSDKWSIEAGFAFDNQNIAYSGIKHSQNRFLPSLQIEYSPVEDINIKFSYIADVIYPNIKQLSTIKSIFYPNVYHIGNPNLKSAVKHKFFFDINLFDMLNFAPSLDITKNAICPLIFSNGNNHEITYRNANIKELLLPINISFPVSERLFCSLGLGYYKSFGKYQKTSNNYGGLYCCADVMYNGKFINLNAGYYHSIQKESIIQGYDETGLDSWILAANRQWLNKRLTTAICWFLPLELGIKSSTDKHIWTESFYLHENKSLKPYRNTFNIQIVYRFLSGKNKVYKKKNIIETERRIKGAITNF